MTYHSLDTPTHLGADDLSFSDTAPAAFDPVLPIETVPPTAAEAAPAAVHAPRLTWVPIRSLTSRHRSRIQAHLLGLEARARYLRFGNPASDAQIARYADSIDFERDEVFGIFNRRLELIGLAHLAYESSLRVHAHGAMAEFGVSVAAASRGRGYGARLFDHASLHARNRGFQTLFIHALSENTAILKIARRAGAVVERAGSESDAWLRLPPDDLASHIGAAIDETAAEWDYRLKAQVQRVQHAFEGVGDGVHERIANLTGTDHA